jgi:hypothetical protein
MTTDRSTERWAGVFYIAATVMPILTISFTGFLGGAVAGEPLPDYLAQLSINGRAVTLGVFVELAWALAVVGIVVTLLPTLKAHNESLALGFSGLRFIEAFSTVIHSIILLSLLTLGQEFAAAGSPDPSHFQTAGRLFLAAREWTFLIGSGLVWSLSALVLNYQLYISRLVPRWLSVWGLVGAALSFANYVPRFFGGVSVEVLFYIIAVQEMVFAVWLIVKGFNRPVLVGESAE